MIKINNNTVKIRLGPYKKSVLRDKKFHFQFRFQFVLP